MAKQRVQVRDLPDAPQLQATVRSGGQYNVAVQQAGRNKLMDLADQLSMVNPALREYGALADIDAEMYEDELSRLSTDEVKARLSNTEEQLDSLSRKGFIPWLASPLNQKRKRRAEGKAAQKVFYDQLISSEGRFNNPLEGDDSKTSAEIINEEVAKFAENNPALQGQYVSEGFQEALNPRITQLTAQYDAEKSRVARAETLLNNTSSIYSAAKDATLDSAQYEIDMEQGLVDWSELNSFNAAQQIKVIENVAEQLAASGDERRAYTFLKWADKNLKVGNGKLGEDQYDRIMDSIEKTAEIEGKMSENDRDERLEQITSKFTLAVNAIDNAGEATFNGKTFTDKSALLKAYQENVAQDGDTIYAGKAQQEFESIHRGNIDTADHTRNEIQKKSVAYRMLGERLKNATDTALTDYDDVSADPRGDQFRNTVFQEVINKVESKVNEIIADGGARDLEQASQSLNDFINAEFKNLPSVLERRVEKLDSVIKEENKSRKAQQVLLESSGTEAPTISTGLLGIGADTPEEVAAKIMLANGVIANPDAELNERKAALKVLAHDKAKKATKHFADIAIGQKTKEEWMSTGYGKIMKRSVPYTPSEKEEALIQLVKIKALTGEFADTQVLESGKLPEFNFKSDLIDSRVIVLITPDEAAEIRDVGNVSEIPEDIVKRARLVGRSDDILSFINDQVKLLTRLGRLSN